MGCSPGDNECFDDEKPAHEVTISTGFWMGQRQLEYRTLRTKCHAAEQWEGFDRGRARTAPLGSRVRSCTIPRPGTFTVTGSLPCTCTPSVTLLPNGKVLFAGGYDGTNFVSSAELYDPPSGTFVATGSLNRARAGQSSTLLGNGKVLRLALLPQFVLPTANIKKVGARVGCFRSWIPTPPNLCPRFAAYLTIGLAQDSRPSGSLLLTRKALSSSTPCRFSPAH